MSEPRFKRATRISLQAARRRIWERARVTILNDIANGDWVQDEPEYVEGDEEQFEIAARQVANTIVTQHMRKQAR